MFPLQKELIIDPYTRILNYFLEFKEVESPNKFLTYQQVVVLIH